MTRVLVWTAAALFLVIGCTTPNLGALFEGARGEDVTEDGSVTAEVEVTEEESLMGWVDPEPGLIPRTTEGLVSQSPPSFSGTPPPSEADPPREYPEPVLVMISEDPPASDREAAPAPPEAPSPIPEPPSSETSSPVLAQISAESSSPAPAQPPPEILPPPPVQSQAETPSSSAQLPAESFSPAFAQPQTGMLSAVPAPSPVETPPPVLAQLPAETPSPVPVQPQVEASSSGGLAFAGEALSPVAGEEAPLRSIPLYPEYPLPQLLLPPGTPTRHMAAAVHQTVEVSLPGLGWVYLGEDAIAPLLSYEGREQAGTGASNSGYRTVFTLHAQTPGRTLVQFYKKDIFAGGAKNEFVDFVVMEE